MSIMDWETLNAPDVPKWLVALSSKDEKRQLQAKMKLTRYLQQHALALNIANYAYNEVLETDAPVLITSFLIEMLKDPSVAKPATIAELLEVVVSYRREPALGQPQKERAAKIYELVAREIDLYLDMLNTADDFKARVYVMEILRQMPERQEEITQALMQHLKSNSVMDDLETLTALSILYRAVKDEANIANHVRSEFVDTLNQYFEHDHTPKSVLARASCYLMFLQGDKVSQTAVDTLVDLLKEANFTDPMEGLDVDELWIDALLTRGTQ